MVASNMKRIGNIILLDFEEIKNHDKVNIGSLVSNTYNTWQTDRTEVEKKKDTELGKFAEECVTTALDILNINNYHSYDSIRNDSFKYHAPFDGILSDNMTNDLVDMINTAVIREGSKLSSKTREDIRKKKAYTVEIKSTRLAKKYKERAGFISYENESQLNSLINELKTLDFITYPYFTRYGDMTFDQYCWYAEMKFLHSYLRGQKLRDYVKEIELKNATDIYIRVFVDEELKKALIMGWISREKMFEYPKTHKLILPGKSEIPLYFVKGIKYGKPLEDIKKDYFN